MFLQIAIFDEMPSESFLVVSSLIVNVVSSVMVIFANKQLVFGWAGFHFGTILTIIHFVATFLGCLCCVWMGWSERKKLRLKSVFLISCAFCGYVVFNNLSLLKNSVTVYQVSKIVCTPVIAIIEYRKYHNQLSLRVLFALFLVCCGSVLTVGGDTSLSAVGLLWCFLAIVSNSFYTVWGKSMQVDLECSPLQLLFYQAPISATMLLLSFPLFDNVIELWHYQWTFATLISIVVSCIFAFGVNFSFFVFVGKTSGLTMNVVGYLKTALVFVINWLFNSAEMTTSSAVGTMLTLIGLALYMMSKSQHSVGKRVS